MTRRVPIQLFTLLGLALALACNDSVAPTDSGQASLSAAGRSAFGFNGNASGFPTGAVRLTGGGSYDPATASNIIPTLRMTVPAYVLSAGSPVRRSA